MVFDSLSLFMSISILILQHNMDMKRHTNITFNMCHFMSMCLGGKNKVVILKLLTVIHEKAHAISLGSNSNFAYAYIHGLHLHVLNAFS